MIRLWRWHREQNRKARAAVAASEQVHAEIEAQWPEVRRLAALARQERAQNHLTELFLGFRGGNP